MPTNLILLNGTLPALAEAILPQIDEEQEKAIEIAEDSLNAFESIYKKKWLVMMNTKLGLSNSKKMRL